MDIDTSRVILHGVVNYALDKLNGYTSKPTLSLLQEYISSLYSSADLKENRPLPFRTQDLHEALVLCLEASPFFNQNTIKMEQHFQATFLVGNRVTIMTDLLTILTYMGTLQQKGHISIALKYETEDRALHVTLKGSALSRSDLDKIQEIAAAMAMRQTLVHELEIVFPCTVMGNHPVETAVKGEPSREKFAYLYQIAGDMPGMVKDILQTMVDMMPDELKVMQNALDARHFEEIREVAHKIKSNFRTIEREEIALLLEQIEAAARAGDAGLLRGLIAKELTEQVNGVMQELKDYL